MKNNKSKGKVKMTKFEKIVDAILMNILGTCIISSTVAVFFGLQGMDSKMYLYLSSRIGMILLFLNIFISGIRGGLRFLKNSIHYRIQFRKPMLSVKFRSPIVIRKLKNK